MVSKEDEIALVVEGNHAARAEVRLLWGAHARSVRPQRSAESAGRLEGRQAGRPAAPPVAQPSGAHSTRSRGSVGRWRESARLVEQRAQHAPRAVAHARAEVVEDHLRLGQVGLGVALCDATRVMRAAPPR
jgi:hypothetical protein